MDDNSTQENPAPADTGLNKLDLSQLHGFSFGTQWSQEKRDGRDDRPRREDRREGGAPERRDRRSFRRPAEGEGAAPVQREGAPAGAQPEQRREPRREGGEFRGGPRRDARPGEARGGEFRGGPRRDEGGDNRGPRGEFRGGPRQGHGGDRFQQADRGPYESPFFTATFYPEDTSFATLAKTIRSSCRTIELFEIARTVIGKVDRFVVVLQRKPQQAEAAPGAVPGVKQAPIYISVPDGVPFDTEEGVINHVMQKHLGQFFETAEVEVEAPKGNYQIINRCAITGELLAPPNYHRYNQIVAQHHANRISRLSLEAYRATKIESVRDQELVNQWLAKMKKVTRYSWKLDRPAAAAPVAPAAPAAEGAEPVAAAEAPAAPAPEAAPAGPAFDSIEEARVHLLTHAREKVVRTTESARFHGKLIELMPAGEIRRAIEGLLERQRRFPLDTANALRGRLRREGFTIFKKGSKGVSYVCAVKRKFRVPGQVFSESINALITFIEAHPMAKAGELPEKFLGITLPKPADKKAEVEAPAAETPAPELAPEQREKLARLQGDLLWLVREGYVTEFIDSRLFAPPPMVEARKKEVEGEEHDPENFPEAPVEPAPAPAAEQPAAPEGEQA